MRIRELGVVPGELNTGVTAIVPPGFAAGLPAAVAVGNGYGKPVGSTQVDELELIRNTAR